jgi:hypothetical protein
MICFFTLVYKPPSLQVRVGMPKGMGKFGKVVGRANATSVMAHIIQADSEDKYPLQWSFSATTFELASTVRQSALSLTRKMLFQCLEWVGA